MEIAYKESVAESGGEAVAAETISGAPAARPEDAVKQLVIGWINAA